MARSFALRGRGRRWRLPPPAVLSLLYLGCIVVGAGLLRLPVAHHGGIGWSEALFTATSAVTVTGLTLVDTGAAFTLFGQAVIVVLVQLGGLGLMTFAVLVLAALDIPLGMPQRLMLSEDLNQPPVSNLATLVRVVALAALTFEALGAVALAFVFVPEFGFWRGVWEAVFHSVSAFNNAGFGLHPDSLSRWVADPVINLVVPALFIVGGLGFVVLADLDRVRGWRRLTLHSKLMLSGTLALIVWAWAMFAALEWSNPATLGALDGLGAKLWASWFQAVTPRTAGFNTLDIGALRDSTTLMMMTLMLVGGGSASTAGGVKVTTLIVLLLATIAFFRRRQALHAFGRSLGATDVMKVLALTTVSMLMVLSGIFLMAIHHDGEFLDLAFEVTSAFGTVGLTRGETTELDAFGRALIMVFMFFGRVGPLTLGFFLATRSVPRLRYPGGHVHLG